MQPIRRLLTFLGTIAAHPAAFIIVAAYAVLWAVFEPGGLEWHGVATLAIWCMTLLIQRTEHRDMQAIHAKLDELLRAQSNASSTMTSIDKEEPEDIERQRKTAQKSD